MNHNYLNYIINRLNQWKFKLLLIKANFSQCKVKDLSARAIFRF